MWYLSRVSLLFLLYVANLLMKKFTESEKKIHREVFPKIYENAQRMMFVKEKLKKELPPRGSSFYRYFSDSKSNPPSYYELCKEIDDMTLEDCKNHPYWRSNSNLGWV